MSKCLSDAINSQSFGATKCMEAYDKKHGCIKKCQEPIKSSAIMVEVSALSDTSNDILTKIQQECPSPKGMKCLSAATSECLEKGMEHLKKLSEHLKKLSEHPKKQSSWKPL